MTIQSYEKSFFREVIPVLKFAWSDCEEVISAIGLNTWSEVPQVFGIKKAQNIADFLTAIKFLGTDQNSLFPNYSMNFTDIGKDYYTAEYIWKDSTLSKKILAKSLEAYLPTQAICQLLWGRPNINKESVYRLLILQDFISVDEFKENDLGGFLMLLNQCGFIKYNKRTGVITINYNSRAVNEGFDKVQTKFLSPDTPYSNVRNLKEILRNSTEYVHWFDKHFSAKGLEPLVDEVDGTKIHEIKILSGITSGRINEHLKNDFARFSAEMKSRQITVELRVLCDKTILNTIHDRWILSKDSIYNIPPIDTIYQGQYSELKRTTNKPPFKEWWSQGLDILTDWDKITKCLPP
jgi:hypothetical protein